MPVIVSHGMVFLGFKAISLASNSTLFPCAKRAGTGLEEEEQI